MINTSAFESYKRYELLETAFLKIKSENGLSPYDWMLPFLRDAIGREIKFMLANQRDWIGDMPLEDKKK